MRYFREGIGTFVVFVSLLTFPFWSAKYFDKEAKMNVPTKYKEGKILEERFSNQKCNTQYRLMVKSLDGSMYVIKVKGDSISLGNLELLLKRGDKIKFPIENGYGSKFLENGIGFVDNKNIIKVQ